MRILIVEDTSELAYALQHHLKEVGFIADIALDGVSGLSFARKTEYDLIILDYTLPGKSGRDICIELRSMGSSVPILMLSVVSDTTSKADLLSIGADDYMTKPFSVNELIARVRALLRRPSLIAPDEYRIGDVIIDLTKQIVHKDSMLIDLTAKEFKLLEYLVRNRGSVLTRAKIMEHAWDMNGDVFSNSIETHILNIRKKIGDIDHLLVVTVPGRGYMVR